MFVHFSFTVDKHAKPTLNKKLVDEKNRGSVCDLILLGIGALPTITPNPNSCLGIRVVCASACQATNQATGGSQPFGEGCIVSGREGHFQGKMFFPKFFNEARLSLRRVCAMVLWSKSGKEEAGIGRAWSITACSIWQGMVLWRWYLLQRMGLVSQHSLRSKLSRNSSRGCSFGGGL